MKSVLISIKPYYVFLIIAHKMGWDVSREKTIEVRKDFPKDQGWNKVVHIYCGKDQKSFNRIPVHYQPVMERFLGKVIGEFIFDEIITFEPRIYKDDGSLPWDSDCIIYACDKRTCLTEKQFEEYGKGKTLYGWHISNLVIYDKPKELYDFIKPCPYNYDCSRCEFISRNDGVCRNFVTRPPQSWCYVDEKREEIAKALLIEEMEAE